MRVNSYNFINNSGYPSLIKEFGVNYPEKCDEPKKIAEMMRHLYSLDCLMVEEFWVICMNTQNKILGAMQISKGGYDFSIVDMKSLFTRVLLLGSAKIIVCHNHPSGCTTPSKQDAMMTEKIKQASNLLDIELCDHIIITGDDYYSFRDHNFIL